MRLPKEADISIHSSSFGLYLEIPSIEAIFSALRYLRYLCNENAITVSLILYLVAVNGLKADYFPENVCIFINHKT